MAPTLVISHYIFSVLIGLCALAVYRKSKESDVSMLTSFWKFFAIWAGLFFFPMALGFHLGWLYDAPTILSLGMVLPHIFAFIAVGYLWRTLSAINFPEYSNIFWGFVAYGIGIGAYGLYEMPPVAAEAGGIILPTGSLFTVLIPAGMGLAAVAIAASSFYSAYQLRGEQRIKLGLLGLGTLLALLVTSNLHNMGLHVLGDITNTVWILMFMSIAYWSEIHEKWPR